MLLLSGSPDVKWSSFQAFVQLAVALNATYATIATFLGNNILREERQIRLLMRKAERLQTGAQDDHASGIRTLRLIDLSGRSTKVRKHYETAIDLAFRPACGLGFALSFAVLMWSSFYFDCKMNGWGLLATFASALPFVAGFLYSLGVLVYVHFMVTRPRKRQAN